MDSQDCQVVKVLNNLVGEQLWSCGRAADLLWLQFGDQVQVRTFRGQIKVVGRFALHIQCAWKLEWPGSMQVASDSESNLDIDRALASLAQVHLPAVVVQVSVLSAGGFRLALERGGFLEVFPDASDEEEQWRLLQPYQGPHFVFERAGLSEQ